MKPSAAIAQALAQREFDVEVGPGQRIRLRRPPQMQWDFAQDSFVSLTLSCLVGWSGIKESDFLGASVGSDELQEFEPELAKLVLSDNADWLGACVKGLVENISAKAESIKRDAGNSAPS